MQRLRAALKVRQVGVTCAFVFLVDVVMGMLLPSFSLYAKRLGAPLTLIGFLGTVIGLARILASLPMGMTSDARGRRIVLASGALLLAAASFLHTVIEDPRLLLPVRALVGVGMTATFPIGAAHLGDVVPARERSVAIGLYYASMGFGFAIGPVVAGAIASTWGYWASYRLAGFLAALAAVMGLTFLSGPGSRSRQRDQAEGNAASLALTQRVASLSGKREILAAGLANLLVAGAFHGAVVGFLPLRASALAISDETFGLLFSVRTLVSTAARLPAGFLNVQFSGRRVIIATLTFLGAAHLFASYATGPPGLGASMLFEGIAYGVFVTSGQDFVIERSSSADRGAVVGLYGTLGSLGSTIGPLALGLVADSLGLTPVFTMSGCALFAGVLAIAILSRRGRPAPTL